MVKKPDLRKLFNESEDLMRMAMDDNVEDFALEQFYFNQKEKHWVLVVSFSYKNPKLRRIEPTSGMTLPKGVESRVFKEFRYDSNSKFVGMFDYTRS